ncbi:MAG: hypothetical protein ACFNVK_04015 [Prevotella sp.]
MNKQEFRKKPYIAAQCTIVNVEAENFFCGSKGDFPVEEEPWQPGGNAGTGGGTVGAKGTTFGVDDDYEEELGN